MEILYRAKRKDNKEWIEGYYAETIAEMKGFWTAKMVMQFIITKDAESFLIDRETVSRYTGITDRNNVKIFENDIVKTKYGRLCKVIWFSSPSYQGWDLLPIESEHEKPSERDLWNNLEVVGNVFDNYIE